MVKKEFSETPIAMVMVPSADWQKMQDEIGKISEYICNKEKESQSEWLTSEQTREILGVSKRTWQTYRNRRLIPFSQIGKTILVKKSDLEKFISNHNIKKHYNNN